MGQVVDLAAHRAARRRREAAAAAPPPEGVALSVPAFRTPAIEFFFDLASPFTYIAVERVDRLIPMARWTPASGEALHRRDPWSDQLSRDAAERRASLLRIPLSWPDRPAEGARGAMRAAAHAAECGRAALFVIAASRLAFCGGFDLDDPEVLVEAAAAAGLGLDECLAAARDESRDGAIEAAGRRLLAAGADRLPAVRVGRAVFSGEGRIAEAVLAAREGAAARVPHVG